MSAPASRVSASIQKARATGPSPRSSSAVSRRFDANGGDQQHSGRRGERQEAERLPRRGSEREKEVQQHQRE
jgi:hypothetical protein